MCPHFGQALAFKVKANRMTDILLKLFGLYCDPESAIPIPELKKPSPGVSIPGNVTFDAKGKSFLNTHTEDGMISEAVAVGRCPTRTPGDDNIIGMDTIPGKPRISPEKYFRLKPYWAKGMSAKSVSDILKREHGYGERTLDYYWSAFAASQKFDLEKNK